MVLRYPVQTRQDKNDSGKLEAPPKSYACVSTLRYFAAFPRCIVVLLYRIPPHRCANWPMHCVLVM